MVSGTKVDLKKRIRYGKQKYWWRRQRSFNIKIKNSGLFAFFAGTVARKCFGEAIHTFFKTVTIFPEKIET